MEDGVLRSLTNKACLGFQNRLRAWAADCMARHYVLQGKFSGALAWCNVAMTVETDALCFAVWSLHAALILTNLTRHQVTPNLPPTPSSCCATDLYYRCVGGGSR
jgi:hypothetical protein